MFTATTRCNLLSFFTNGTWIISVIIKSYHSLIPLGYYLLRKVLARL